MKKKRDVVININPYTCELNISSKGFILEFRSFIGTDYSQKKIVRIHFSFYWVRVLGHKLWQVIRYQENDIDSQKAALTEGDDR